MQKNQKDGSNHHPYQYRMPRLSSSTESKRPKARCRKSNFDKNNDNQEELPELTTDLLELIAKRLNMVGYCAFGAVCKNWLKIYNGSKKNFLESQAPMVVLTSKRAKRACNLYDMAKGKTEKVMLPNLVGKSFLGCSAGYMIMEDINYLISFVNPLTGFEFNCPMPPVALNGKFHHDRIILASNSSTRNYVILALSTSKHYLHAFHSRNMNWFVTGFWGEPWVDIAIFRGHVYFVTKKAQFGELSLKATDIKNGYFVWSAVTNTPNVDSHDLKLVVSDNQLSMVDFVPEKHLNIYRMDFGAMKWAKLDMLGDEALFWGATWGSTIRKPGRWGSRSNCVYYLETLSNTCYIYSMQAKLIDKFPLVENSTTSKLQTHGWYYPHQCLKMDDLKDE